MAFITFPSFFFWKSRKKARQWMALPSTIQVDTNENRKENMIDHVILTVSDFKRSVAFYAKALKPLGITALPDYEGKDGHPYLKGFGIGRSHFFWLKEGKPDLRSGDEGNRTLRPEEAVFPRFRITIRC